ncbi:DMT family transporter [Metabacillus fastidiosus]|uniref:DMT family transporter n=1 Tax=Metabacillus fastidiosus TaxID=1458 RepID=A0ABU6P300_9BACI|nr:DMT family transporter [Metabacillus fastidiosus]MED4402879.1 DMT family transporter [Metabacillus fastidiosus]MED4461297.1 DMT family transporter [Metabacillus fastidiosus]
MNKKVFLLAFITIIIWGSTFAAIRASLQGGYSAGHLVLIRFLIASSIFLIYALWPGVQFQLPKKEDVIKILALGWVGISIYHIGVTFGELTVEAGTAGMIIGSAPVFTSLIAVIVLKEKLGLFGWAGLFVGFIGIILITIGTTGQSFHISEGALFMLLAAVATSVFFVFQKPLFSRYKPIELTAYFTWAGTLPFFIFFPGLFEDIQHATIEAHLSAIYVGIFPAAIAYVMWATALSLGKASSVTSMMYVEPVIAIFVAWLWLREWPSTLSLIGGIIAISGVIIVNWLGSRTSYVTG